MEDIFDFSNLDGNHEIFSNKKVIGKFKLETPKKIGLMKFVCLRSKVFSFKCGDDIKNKLTGFCKPQSKHNKYEEYKNCFDEEECQEECADYILKSIDHEM